MAKLILVHESGDGAEYHLKPGVTTIGRDPGNDLSINHESISEFHCELRNEVGGIQVQDLGSEQGTWVDMLRVEEGKLSSGQTLQVGEIQFVLQVPVRIRGSQEVGNHPASPGDPDIEVEGETVPDGSVYCAVCEQWYEPEVTSQRRVGFHLISFCPHCGGRCVTETDLARTSDADQEVTFAEGVTKAFAYPFAGGGWGLLLAGTVGLTITHYAAVLSANAFVFGLLALLILTIGVTGYLFQFAKDVISTSAMGVDLLPGWPDITSPGDFVGPFFQFLALHVVSFGPVLLWALWAPEDSSLWVPIVLVVLGTVYLPMAMLGLAMADSVSGLNPAVIVPSIVSLPGHYAAVFLLAVLFYLVQAGGGWVVELIPIPILPMVALQFLALYLMIVTCRVLGVMYYVNRERLGWF